MPKTHKGSCLCGAIKVSTKKFEDDGIWFCHCGQCRKNYGLYGAFIGIPKASLKVSGKKNIRWFRSSKNVRRGFCKTCGSAIFWEYAGSKRANLLAGLFETLNIHNGRHIFMADKGGFYQVKDSLPKFKKTPK